MYCLGVNVSAACLWRQTNSEAQETGRERTSGGGRTHLEMRTTTFMACTATSLSLSWVMEISRSWKRVFTLYIKINALKHHNIMNISAA